MILIVVDKVALYNMQSSLICLKLCEFFLGSCQFCFQLLKLLLQFFL